MIQDGIRHGSIVYALPWRFSPASFETVANHTLGSLVHLVQAKNHLQYFLLTEWNNSYKINKLDL